LLTNLANKELNLRGPELVEQKIQGNGFFYSENAFIQQLKKIKILVIKHGTRKIVEGYSPLSSNSFYTFLQKKMG